MHNLCLRRLSGRSSSSYPRLRDGDLLECGLRVEHESSADLSGHPERREYISLVLEGREGEASLVVVIVLLGWEGSLVKLRFRSQVLQFWQRILLFRDVLWICGCSFQAVIVYVLHFHDVPCTSVIIRFL